MGHLELHTRQHFPSEEEGRYAVYFSHGDRFVVIAKSEAEAKAKAEAQYFEWGGYCTRTERLEYEEIEETQNKRAEKINTLFSNLNAKTENKDGGSNVSV